MLQLDKGWYENILRCTVMWRLWIAMLVNSHIHALYTYTRNIHQNCYTGYIVSLILFFFFPPRFLWSSCLFMTRKRQCRGSQEESLPTGWLWPNTATLTPIIAVTFGRGKGSTEQWWEVSVEWTVLCGLCVWGILKKRVKKASGENRFYQEKAKTRAIRFWYQIRVDGTE